MTVHPQALVDVVAAYLAGWLDDTDWPRYRPDAEDLLDIILTATAQPPPEGTGADLRHPDTAWAKCLSQHTARPAEPHEETQP